MNNGFIKKCTAIALALSIGVSLIPAQSVSLAADKKSSSKTAVEETTEDDGYERIEIRTAQDFIDFASNCYIDSWSTDKYVVLMDDIDLIGVEFVPVPVFNGTFDGGGHTISGFDYVGNGYVVGLFRYVEANGTIKDLNLTGNISSENEEECIGSIVGINYGTIKNCTFTGTVSGRDTVGGIVGINESTGTISSSVAKGRVTAYYSTGGIAGINHGAINYCSNRAGINDNQAWVETDDEMGGVEIVKNLVETDETEVYSGIDTGGIAGYSDGFITRCTNSGTVGYEHTGYNIGGIAGRQAGVVSLCTNNGIVYGRKDVGGIVGQMEPDIEINEAESLRDALDKLHDLMNKTIDDMSETKNVINSDIDIMQQFADAAIDTGDDLITQISDFADNNIGDINTLTSRMEHVMDMIPEVIDHADEAGDAAKRLNNVLKQLSDDIDVMAKLDDSEYNETEYNRISTHSTVGGTITTNSSNPAAGDEVTITVKPSDGYKLKSKPVVTDVNGKQIAVTDKDKYTFTMPEENVKVEAEFEYEGTFIVKSNVGGNVITSIDGDKYTFTVEPSNGYDVDTVTIDGESVDSNNKVTKDENDYTVNRNDYKFNGTSKYVEVNFKKNSKKLYNVNVVSSTGGSAMIVGDSEAGEGEYVTISVSRSSDYKFESNKIRVNEIETEVLAQGDGYRFKVKMPEMTEQYKEYTITVPFEYNMRQLSSTETNVVTESNPGGTITAVKQQGAAEDTYRVIINANDGYDVDNNAVTEYIYDNPNNSYTSSNAKEKSTLTDNSSGSSHSYEYIFDNSSNQNKTVKLVAKFVKETNATNASTEYSVMTFSSTGGTIVANTSSEVAGETVTITPASSDGYVLKEIKVTNEDGTEIATPIASSNGKTYTFTMPSANVRVKAQFEPIEIILSSNQSGSATYSGSSQGIVSLKVNPDTSFTLDGAPIVTDKDGKQIAVSKKQSGSYDYEFSVAGRENERYYVNITFKQQNNSQTIDTATDEIDNEIDNLTSLSDNVEKSVNNIRDIVTNSDGSTKTWNDLTNKEKENLVDEVVNLGGYIADMSSSASTILRNLSVIYNILEPYVSDAAEAARKDVDKANEEVNAAIEALDAANDAINSIVNYINDQESIKFSQLGDGFDATKELFHDQLKAISNSIKTLNDNASTYSDIINNDLKAMSDQLNVVFNLLLDRVNDVEDFDADNMFEDVSDEDIESITTGRVEYSKNTGIIQGDINIGGITGSMSIDDEDPEDSAAGSVEYKIGRSFIAKCLITGCVNEGYITAKKDGAGGICGYMNHGIIVESEGYGSVVSTEGDYVGGICGQSLTIIKRCYVLCSVSGGENVGGIAGYADTLTDCYAMADVTADNGRVGAIAGQVASYEQMGSNDIEDASVSNNYYVNDELYGIDNISYVGVAEPISYSELLEVESMPTQFWHLKVIYRIEDTYLGSQEIKYGTKLDNLTFPTIPEKKGYYGVWPDVSDKIMNCTIVVEGEYKDDVTVVRSTGIEDEDDGSEKALALVEDRFTEDTVLIAKKVDIDPPDDIEDKSYVTYDVSLENGGIGDNDTLSVRLLNPYDDATVYAYTDEGWQELESKVRGQYLQVTMTGPQQYFCIVDNKSNTIMIIVCAVVAGVVLILVIALIKKGRAHRKRRKLAKQQNNEEL